MSLMTGTKDCIGQNQLSVEPDAQVMRGKINKKPC